MTRQLRPEERLKLRVKLATEHEFAHERNLVDERASRSEVREALRHLSPMEQHALQERLRRRLRHLHELMADQPKSFEEPYARPEDLPAEVRLANETH